MCTRLCKAVRGVELDVASQLPLGPFDKVAPFDAAYNGTVGATVGMMQSSDYQNYLNDPAGYAALIIELANTQETPVRLLAGADAYAMGTNADDVRRASDVRWEALSCSATEI